VHNFKIQGDTLWLTMVNFLGKPVTNPTTFRLARGMSL
jgi:hypothetical protein